VWRDSDADHGAIHLDRNRERGNLEMLITTPVKSPELMIGKIISYVVIGYIQILIILLLGVTLFDVPVRGSLWDFYAGAGIFVISRLSLGLLISTIAETQFHTLQITFISFLPQLLLSRFMFPFEGMLRSAVPGGDIPVDPLFARRNACATERRVVAAWRLFPARHGVRDAEVRQTPGLNVLGSVGNET
jgi:ABC-type multidrug transport system permease subunit